MTKTEKEYVEKIKRKIRARLPAELADVPIRVELTKREGALFLGNPPFSMELNVVVGFCQSSRYGRRPDLWLVSAKLSSDRNMHNAWEKLCTFASRQLRDNLDGAVKYDWYSTRWDDGY